MQTLCISSLHLSLPVSLCIPLTFSCPFPLLQEFVVLTSFINDIMQCGDPLGDPQGHAQLMRTTRAVFPYYKIGKECRVLASCSAR